MGFLWQLLPGAREARNQVITGYAWLFAVATWVGVPTVAHGNLQEIVNALGHIGVGVVVSVGAFLIGSLSDDLLGARLRIRGGQALTRGSELPAFLTIQRMNETGARTELEQLEASIDRGNAEVLLRAGLILPAIVMSAGLTRGSWYAAVGGLVVMTALAWQAWRRFSELSANLDRSVEIRSSVAESLEDEPETQRFRAKRAAEKAARDQAWQERLDASRAETDRLIQDSKIERDRVLGLLNELDAVEALGVLNADEAARADVIRRELGAGLLRARDNALGRDGPVSANNRPRRGLAWLTGRRSDSPKR